MPREVSERPLLNPLYILPETSFTTKGEEIAFFAQRRIQQYSLDYAKENAPRSPNPSLSGNYAPGYTVLNWLKGRYKCNQFVGDVLSEANVPVPMYSMPNGTKHYVNAENFPRYLEYFQYITERSEIRSGDLIVIDYTSPGEDGAHIEIVTDNSAGTLRMAGAHYNGAYERENSDIFNGAIFHTKNKYWIKEDKKIYVLRARG